MSKYKKDHIYKGGYSKFIDGKFKTIIGLEKSLDGIKDAIDEVFEYAESVEQENREILDANWKDKQLLEMEAKVNKAMEDLRRGFEITEDEMEAIKKWKDQHWANKHNALDLTSRLAKKGAIGGTFEYRFVPTSIGVSGTIVCSACNQKMEDELGSRKDYEKSGDYHDKRKKLIEKYDSEFEFKKIG